MMRGIRQHLIHTLKLNFRSGRAIAYGYIMPVIFLLGFGSIFRSGDPLLLAEMGQILTITILGGACLGMPTSLVSERELGLWRQYQLLPVPVNALLLNVFLVRAILVAGAIFLQIVLANVIYGTPFPTSPISFATAYLLVIFSFIGIGMLITAFASDVPSVQALGQCVFLPMILIGGVGVPLQSLPEWARIVASFMPGRYSVELLQFTFENGFRDAIPWFPVGALAVIGFASLVAGLRLVRWEPGSGRKAYGAGWLVFSLASWCLVGGVAVSLDRVEPFSLLDTVSFEEIRAEDIAAITYDGLPDDRGIYTPLAPPLSPDQRLTHRMSEFRPRLLSWRPGLQGNTGQRVRNLIAVAAIADITQDNSEAIIARQIFDHLRDHVVEEALVRALAWIILSPDAGSVVSEAPELGLRGEAHPSIIRERSSWYARKFLGRINGAISDGVQSENEP